VKDAAYFVSPSSGPGHPLLLLHSWWGLDSGVRKLADRISDEGHTVLVPDLLTGRTFEDADAAEEHLKSADANRLASLTQASVHLVRERGADRDAPVSIVGMSMGASLGLWASIRIPDAVSRVVSFYGTQTIDFAGAKAAYQLHFADDDEIVDSDEAAFMEATIGLNGLSVESHSYPGTSHWFFEPERPNYDAEAAEQAWERMVEFLRR
jgi:carboxymethylenebutenolidase